jgi:vitamin B12 transporter
MNIKQLSLAAAVSALTFTTATNAVLGPIPIYLNTEYRTDAPVIGSIASTLSFDADDIKETGANTFLEFLSTIPGVGLINAQGNIPAIFMRGNESDHTLVLIDGASVNDISSVGGAVGYGLKVISLNDIEKVEIIKGSGSVLYGASAIAGVIAITTKKGAEGNNATVRAKFGTHNSRTYNLSASSGDKEGFVRFTHNKYSTDGINARTDFSAAEKDSISNHATQIKFGNEQFHASYLENTNKTEYDNCWNGSAYVDNCLADRKLNKIAISINKKISETWSSKLSLTHSKTNVSTYEGGAVSIYSSDDYKSTNITLLNDIKVNGALLNVGLSKINDKNITDNQKFSSKDVFVNWQKNINDIDVNTGLRHIKHDEFGNHTVYNVGIGKHLGDDIKLTANYNTAFNAPSLYQAFAPDNLANLKPEISKNTNIGLSKQHSWGKTSIELYKNTVSDMIAYKGWLKYANEDRLTTKGIEASLNTSVAGYNVSFSHNYNNSKLNNSTRQSARRPKNTTNVNINKKYGKFNSKLQVIKKSSSWDLNTTDNNLKGYTLVNLSTEYKHDNNTSIALTINNATDRSYVTAKDYSQLGRTVKLGLEYKF